MHAMNTMTTEMADKERLLEELPMLVHLKDTVRELAVAIAEAMGDGAVHSSRHVSTAIAIARDIVSGAYRDKLGGSTIIAEEAHARWVVRRLDADVPLATFMRRDDAVRRGLELAGRHDVDFIVFGPRRSIVERYARRDIRAPWMDIVEDHLAQHAANDTALPETTSAIVHVEREGRTWFVRTGDGERESHRTKKAALASATALAEQLGAEIVVG